MTASELLLPVPRELLPVPKMVSCIGLRRPPKKPTKIITFIVKNEGSTATKIFKGTANLNITYKELKQILTKFYKEKIFRKEKQKYFLSNSFGEELSKAIKWYDALEEKTAKKN